MARNSVVINNKFVQDAFGSYLKNYRKFKQSSVNSYLSDMRSITKYLNDNKFTGGSIYDVDVIKFNKLMKNLYHDSEFLYKDETRHRVFTAVLNHYADFMNKVYSITHN